MFRAQKREPLFLEQATQLQKNRHSYIECVPVPADIFDTAPAYFRKSILDSDEEWATNPRLLETKGRLLRQVIPKGFPYFHVEFGVGNGFVHVIEDEALFPRSFGKEIIAGMLELDKSVLHAPRASRSDAQAQVRAFKEAWQPFD